MQKGLSPRCLGEVAAAYTWVGSQGLSTWVSLKRPLLVCHFSKAEAGQVLQRNEVSQDPLEPMWLSGVEVAVLSVCGHPKLPRKGPAITDPLSGLRKPEVEVEGLHAQAVPDSPGAGAAGDWNRMGRVGMWGLA